MNSNFSNPLQWVSSPNKTAIYRPKYRQRTTSNQFALDGTAHPQLSESASLLDTIQSLEEWRAEEDQKEHAKGYRWHPQQANALIIYIEPNLKSTCSHLLLRACHEWEACSAGSIHFIESVRPSEALIRFERSENVVLGRTYEVGHTSRQIQAPGWIIQATVSLVHAPEIDKHLIGNQLERRLYATILHELGHALGLEHSPNKNDVMFHQGWRNTQLTLNDMECFQALYQRSPNALQMDF